MRATPFLVTKARLPGPLARFATCARGVTAIEFAFVAPMIIALLLAAFQISTLYVAEAYLDSVTEKAMRIVLTNQSYTLKASDFKTQLCANVNAMFDCTKVIVDLQSINDCSGTGSALTTCFNKYQPTFDAAGTQTSTPAFTSGAQGDKMRLLVMYRMAGSHGAAVQHCEPAIPCSPTSPTASGC